MQIHLKQIINGKIYNTKTATLLASNEYWDGNNWERSGTNTHLYQTKKKSFFFGYSTQWQGGNDHIELCSEQEARNFYEDMIVHDTCETKYADIFGEPEEG